MRRFLIGLIGVLFGVGALIASALSGSAAYAHSELESTQPKEGVVVQKAPTEIVLTYNQPVGKRFGQVAVTGPDGKAYVEGDLEVSGETATQPLKPLGPEGKYEVGWRVVSADGHPISGSFSFWLGSKTSDDAPAFVERGPSIGLIVSVAVAAAGILIAASGLVLAIVRRRQRS